MLDLGILSSAFPTVGAYCGSTNGSNRDDTIAPSRHMIRGIHSGCMELDDVSTCRCPMRESIPPKPNALPFEPVQENNEKDTRPAIGQVCLSSLNRVCKRETFSVESPFHITRCIPGKSMKTVTDAWNGYHSVPLRE